MSLDKNEYVLGLGKFDLDDNDIKYLKKFINKDLSQLPWERMEVFFIQKKEKNFVLFLLIK